MDSPTSITIITALAALIGAASPIIVALIQSTKDKPKQSNGIYLPSDVVLHRPKTQIRWFVVLLFAFLGGIIGFIGTTLASANSSAEISEIPSPTKNFLLPSTNTEITLDIAWTSEENQIKATWENLPSKDNLYLITYAYSSNKYFSPFAISTKSGERTITISKSITEIAIVALTGATTETFPTTGVEKGNAEIAVDVLIQKSIPTK